MRRLIVAIVAIAIIAVAAIGVHSVRARRISEAREQQHRMRSELAAMRTAIHRYRVAHGTPPATLHDAMANVPADPVTRRAGTWRLTMEENVHVDDFAQPATSQHPAGIVDVHSGAPGRDSDGRLWSEY